MGITIKPKIVRGKLGYSYNCSCGNPDIEVTKGEDYYCYSCDAWRAWPTKDEILELHGRDA